MAFTGSDNGSDQTEGRRRVLLLHGYVSGRSAWQQVQAALPAGIDSLAPDLLGYGRARRTRAAPYSLESITEHLLPILARFKPTAIIGHSMGGLAALALAGSQPASFRSVGIVGLPVFHSAEDGLASMRQRGLPYRLFIRSHRLSHAGCTVLRISQPAWLPAISRLGPSPTLRVVFDHNVESHVRGLLDVAFGGQVSELAAAASVPVHLIHGDGRSHSSIRQSQRSWDT